MGMGLQVVGCWKRRKESPASQQSIKFTFRIPLPEVPRGEKARAVCGDAQAAQVAQPGNVRKRKAVLAPGGKRLAAPHQGQHPARGVGPQQLHARLENKD